MIVRKVSWFDQAREVVDELVLLAHRRSTRLAAVTLEVANLEDTDGLAEEVASLLERAGFPEVEVRLRVGNPQLRVLSAEFER